MERVTGIEPAWPAWKAGVPSVRLCWSGASAPFAVPSACLHRYESHHVSRRSLECGQEREGAGHVGHGDEQADGHGLQRAERKGDGPGAGWAANSGSTARPGATGRPTAIGGRYARHRPGTESASGVGVVKWAPRRSPSQGPERRWEQAVPARVSAAIAPRRPTTRRPRPPRPRGVPRRGLSDRESE